MDEEYPRSDFLCTEYDSTSESDATDDDFDMEDLLNQPFITFPISATRYDPLPAPSPSTNRCVKFMSRVQRPPDVVAALRALLDSPPHNTAATRSHPRYLPTPSYETSDLISLTNKTFDTLHPFVLSYIKLTAAHPCHQIFPTPPRATLLWVLLAIVLWFQPMHPAYLTFWRPAIAKSTADTLLAYMRQDWSQIGTWPENYYIWLLNKYRPIFTERMMKESWFNPEAGRWHTQASRKKRDLDGVTTRSSAKRKLREEDSVGMDGRAEKKLKPSSPRKRGRTSKATTPAAAKAEPLDSTLRVLTKRSPRRPSPPEAMRRSTRHKHATEKANYCSTPLPDAVSPLVTVTTPSPISAPNFLSDRHPHVRSRTISSTSSSTTVRSSGTPDSNSSDSTAVEDAPCPTSVNSKAVDINFKTPGLTAMKTRARAKMESAAVDVDVPVPTKEGKAKKRSVSAPYAKDKEVQIASGRGGGRGKKVPQAEAEEEVTSTKKRPGRSRNTKKS